MPNATVAMIRGRSVAGPRLRKERTVLQMLARRESGGRLSGRSAANRPKSARTFKREAVKKWAAGFPCEEKTERGILV